MKNYNHKPLLEPIVIECSYNTQTRIYLSKRKFKYASKQLAHYLCETSYKEELVSHKNNYFTCLCLLVVTFIVNYKALIGLKNSTETLYLISILEFNFCTLLINKDNKSFCIFLFP